MSTTDARPHPHDGAPRVAVAITATSTPVLSHALAHNRVPVVSRLAFATHGAAVSGALVRIGVRDAEGPIGRRVELTVDLDADATTVLSDVDLVVDAAAVLQIEEQRPGVIEIDVTVDGADVGGTAVPVQVLAAGQWLAAPLPLALEMLAAHVLPNHPAVGPLLEEAAALLGERTGDPSLEGCAAGPERVDAVVAAVAAAVRARGVRYGEAAADWAHIAQKVRTPGDVLDGRVGTPLDTTVVLAAALEAAGIRTLLWLTEGHAFLGYWREERSAESAATTDVAPLADLVDLGLVRLVETTLLTSREPADPDAEQLHRAARDAWLAGGPDRVLGVTDVHRARRDGILPLPARTRGPGGALQVVEYRPPAAHPAGRHAAPAPGAPASVPSRVRQWQDDLLDPAARDRLLDLPEGAGLPLVVPGLYLATLTELLAEEGGVALLPSDRLTDSDEEGVSSARGLPVGVLGEVLHERRAVHADVTDGGYLPRLRGLAHRARTTREETGAGDLYLAVGTLAWEHEGRRLRSPLVLLPVVLSPDGDGYRLTADPAAGAHPNGLLLDELRRAHGLTVPGLDPEDGTDVDGVLDAVRQSLAEAGLPSRVEATADLALLRPAAHRRWRDLDASWAELTAAPLADHLARATAAPFRDPVPAAAVDVDLDELAARCPLPSDSSQLRAVAEGVAGRTFVLEGAPGTGKSQTVVNLVARAVAEGKRVLVVAAKRAALDVVARRLEAAGLGGATLPLHDGRAHPAEVRARVLAALDDAPRDPEGEGAAADLADLRAARRTLAGYADRLHAPNAAGLSCYSARTAQLALGDGVPPLSLPPAFAAAAPAQTMAAVRRALALLPDVADLVRPSPRHPWAFVDTADVDLRAAHAAASAVDAAMRALPAEEHLARALREVRTPADLDDLAHLLAGPPVGLDVLDEVPTARWTAATTAVLAEVAAFTSAVHPGLELAGPEALALPLADLYVAAQTAQAARTWARRQGLRAVRDQLAPALRPGVTVKLGDVPELTASLWRLQTAAAGLAARAAVIPGLSVPAGWNPLLDPTVLDGQVAWLRRAGAVVDSARGFAVALRRHVVARPGTDAAAATAVRRLRDELDRLLRVCRSTPARLAEWCGDDGVLLRWAMTRPERGVEHSGLISLRRWAELLDTLEPLRAAGLTEARAALVSGRLPAEDATRALEHGLAAASAAERQAATGLDAFDEDAHDRALARHTAAARAVRHHLVAALPAAVAARRPEDDERVAALRHALDEAPGVATLLAEHGDLVTALLPCVLAGPDAVARFLPARAGLFDLVVVEEASQLRVADAVGALGRARAAVVVGDTRQLPPAPPAECGPAAGEDVPGLPGTAVEDAESILSECLRAGVPRHRLSWHYRSRDESLFAFSNAHYYGNRLSSFPAPTAGRASADVGGHGISLVRVQGTFHRTGAGRLLRTNPMEAKAVVAEIRRRLDAEPDAVPSIGVVTFTTQQRAYVESLLRDAGDERLTAALERTDGEGVFVKDIEDVQGDERDVVLLSTAYSADDRGVLPLNFGPLNRAGGERRLNVAITRARRQVVVFTSFDPAALRAEQTSSLGVKHLRAYLDLAALGTDALPREARAPRVPDRHREEIAAALRERGLGVRTDVGLSDCRVDLALARADAPETPVVAVLLDGPGWARRPTVGDRDGLPAEVLTGVLGWPAVERVWLPAWLRDREAVLDRLAAAVAAVPAPAAAPPALSVVDDVVDAEPEPTPAPDPAPRGPVLRSVASAAVAALPAPRPLPDPATDEPAPVTPPVTLSVVPPVPEEPEEPPADEVVPAPVEQRFRAWAPKPAGDRKVLDGLADPRNARLVTRVLGAGLRAEGPVHRDRLVRLAAGAFGLTRVGEARRDALLALLPAHTLDGDVVWPAALDPATWTVYRRQSASSVRPLEQVPAQEVGNAMVALVRDSGGLGRDELFLRTAEVFGYRRRTPSLAPLLTAALDRAAAATRLTVHDDGRVTS
ncbi:AAA domain-containing protein [Geodermatophilus sp. SYSU D00766]